jgi:hypothetical protein
MKYLKTYEKLKNQVYCIDVSLIENDDLKFGEIYTVNKKYYTSGGTPMYELSDGRNWYAYRFTDDANHPALLKVKTDKYNL